MASFRVMTWNVENLFRPGGDAGPKTPEQYQEKLNSLAGVILQLDPDILAMQEVGSPEALSDLVAKLEGRYAESRLSAHPDTRGIRVGFLSKFAIQDAQEIHGFPAAGLPKVAGVDSHGNLIDVTALGRGALRITVSPRPNVSLHLITAHLKSKLLTYPTTKKFARHTPKDENERALVGGLALLKRVAEAVALRVKANEILENNAQHALIVLGDLNDVTNAATTQLLLGASGSEIGTGGFSRPDAGDDARLFNVAPLIPEARRYSRIHNGNKELIDHILVSQELLPGQPRRVPVVDSFVSDPMPSVTDNPTARRGKPVLDHAPVLATFEF